MIFPKDFSHSCYRERYFWTKFKGIIVFFYGSLPINLVFFHCRFIWKIFIATTFRWGMKVNLTLQPRVGSDGGPSGLFGGKILSVGHRAPPAVLWCSRFCWASIVVALWVSQAFAEALWVDIVGVIWEVDIGDLFEVGAYSLLLILLLIFKMT